MEMVLAKINRDIKVVQENTVIGDDGQEKFSMILNGKTFTDKKDATAHIAEILKKNRNSLFPLKDLSGEYKGLHIFTNFNHDLGREELILEGSYSTRKNATAVAGDNINRIMDMANGRTKLAEDRQKEIDTLHDKIKDSLEELSKPFPQQEEYEQLSMRSTELTNLLNEDAHSTERDKADNRKKFFAIKKPLDEAIFLRNKLTIFKSTFKIYLPMNFSKVLSEGVPRNFVKDYEII